MRLKSVMVDSISSQAAKYSIGVYASGFTDYPKGVGLSSDTAPKCRTDTVVLPTSMYLAYKATVMSNVNGEDIVDFHRR